MDRETLLQILDVQDFALTDAEYLRLHQAYSDAHTGLLALMSELTPEQTQVLAEYFAAATQLHHRLMALALDWSHKNTPGFR